MPDNHHTGAVRAILLNARDSAAGEEDWPEPDMLILREDHVPAPPFDNGALPSIWLDWARSTAEACGCPIDYTVATLVAVAGSVIGNARRVRVTSDWSEPSHLWVALVGPPSSHKTPAMQPFMKILQELERSEEAAWKDRLLAHERDLAVAEIKEDDWRKGLERDLENGLPPTDRPVETVAPKRPGRPRLFVMDPTTEEFAAILSDNPRAVMLIRDELAGWIGSFDRYSGKGADRGFYLEGYNGGPFVIDRVKHKGEPLAIARCSIPILGGMQPDRLRLALNGPDDGFAARLSCVWPDPAPYRSLTEVGNEAQARERDALLLRALAWLRALPITYNVHGDIQPHEVPLSEGALKLFDDLRRECLNEAQQLRGFAAGWVGKSPGRALRLALVIEYLDAAQQYGPEPTCISAETMAHACSYVDYLRSMMNRVRSGLALDHATEDAAALARWIRKTKPEIINLRSLYKQHVEFDGLKKREHRDAVFLLLQQTGWVRAAAASGRAGRPRGDWLVSPRIEEAS
jgi:hypothetical protein